MEAQIVAALEYPLRLTGHPLIDVGVDTLAAMVAQERGMRQEILAREVIHIDELRPIAQKIQDWYVDETMRGYFRLKSIFNNSGFVQPKFTSEKRKAYAAKILFAFLEDYQAEPGEERCTFFPELAANSRAYRQHIPLLNGEEVINFCGGGRHGLPVSGLALLAIHAMPLGCLAAGRFLLFHQIGTPTDSKSTQMNYLLARENYKSLLPRNILSSIQPTIRYSGAPRTRFIHQILHVRNVAEQRDVPIQNISGYYWSNSGQSPYIEILRLDNTVLDFIEEAQQRVPDAWNRVVNSGWQRKKDDAEGSLPQAITRERTNWFYEDLFDEELYLRKPHIFIGRYLAPQKRGSWQLIAIYLERVLLMQKKQIEIYRKLGDKLAEYAFNPQISPEPASLYKRFRIVRPYSRLRDMLRDLAEKSYMLGLPEPLFTFDEFVLAFEPNTPEAQERWHWTLARDLIAIRMLEKLQERNIKIDPSDEEIEEEE